MKSIEILLTLIAAAAPTSTFGNEVQQHAVHDRAFWRAIAQNNYTVSENQPLFPLVRELGSYLGSKDPELRDDLAYGIIATWIVNQKQLSGKQLSELMDEWRANLHIGLGETGTDSVLKRSFSALCLAALAARDLKTPFLGAERYRELLADALVYLREERDLRGFDPTLGWIHATAHTADLLSALASNSLFSKEDQGHVLAAISQRLSSGPAIFSYGEQDRLARAAATIAGRRDFDSAAFERWLSALDSTDQEVWKDTPPKQGLLVAYENNTYMLQGLSARLAMSAPSVVITDAQKAVLRTLKDR